MKINEINIENKEDLRDVNLAGLARNKELYESLERKERKIIKKVFHKEKDWMEVLDDWNYVQ